MYEIFPVRHKVHLTAQYVLEQTHCRTEKSRFQNMYHLPSPLHTTKGKEWQGLASQAHTQDHICLPR